MSDPTKPKTSSIIKCTEETGVNTVSKSYKEVLSDVWDTATDPLFLRHWLEDMERNATMDLNCKLATIATMTSAHTRPRDPLNNTKKGESGIGKTKVVTTVAHYYPPENYILLGGASPKAFIHERGVLMDEQGIEIRDQDEPVKTKRKQFAKGKDGDEEFRRVQEQYRADLLLWNLRLQNSYRVIHFDNITVICLELPVEDTIRMLLPVLSHDTKEYIYKFVDKETFRTTKVVLRGYPATIFLSAKARYMYELVTRSISDTPEGTSQKVLSANALANTKASYPMSNEEESDTEKKIRSFLDLMIHMFQDENFAILIPFEGLNNLFPYEISRNMREFNFLLSIIKSITALHMFQRPIWRYDDSRYYVLSSVDDVNLAYELYAGIFETSRTGSEEALLDFYHQIVKTHEKWTATSLREVYNKGHPNKKVSDYTIGYWMKRLSYIGYVSIEKSTLDKRINMYVPLEKGEKKVGIEGFLKDPTSLRQNLENSFERWLKNVVEKGGEEKGEKIHLLSEASIHKFERSENGICATLITIEDLQDIIKADTNLKYANLKIFPFSSQAIPTSISKEDSSQKSKTSSEIEGKGNNPTLSDNSGDKVCALCDSANGDLMKDFTRLTWEQLKDFPIGEEWQSANKNVLLHKSCFQDLHCRGYSLEDIALRIKEYERIRGKAYFLHLKDVSDLFVEGEPLRYR